MAVIAPQGDLRSTQIAFDVGHTIDQLDVSDTLRQLPDSWPYLLPSWLRTTEALLTDATPWHSVARRGDEVAVLPAFLFERPGLIDGDPRTYLGWRPASGETPCCAANLACCDDATAAVEGLGIEPFFSALVLGSPLGYRSEAGSSEPGSDLLGALVERAVAEARASGVRCVLAPWVADRSGNQQLLDALRREGANVTFWGEENYLPLEHDSYKQHLSALPGRKRRRIREDYDKAAASGVIVRRVDGPALHPFVPRIAQLASLNYQKHDGEEDPADVAALLSALIDDGADVRAYLGSLDGQLVASCVFIRHGTRLVAKWVGFDYAALGERSGLYFTLVLDLPLQDAYAERLTSVEVGPGADQVKRLRGCRPRAISTALLFMADEETKVAFTQLQDQFGRDRRATLDADTSTTTGRAKLLGRRRTTSSDSNDCCG